MFTTGGRQLHAHDKHMKQVKKAREKQRAHMIRHQAEMPSPRSPQPSEPTIETTVQPPENQ